MKTPFQIQLLYFLAAVFAWSLPARAQDDLGPLYIAVGTTVPQESGPSWAYLLWQPSQLNLWDQQPFAVYAKAGAADAPGDYTRLSRLIAQEDPLIIQALLDRSVRLGEDLDVLGERIDDLFQDVMPGGGLTLAEKVSAVVRAAMVDERTRQNLSALGRLHPGINLVLGLAWTGPFVDSGVTTFEVRMLDPATGLTDRVIGRVTLNPATVRRLPAPGPPVRVPSEDSRGHLNVLLRWGSGDALRRLGLLQYGYNVYRVSPAFLAAEDIDPFDWETGTPWDPEPGTLLWYVQNEPHSIKRVNRLPVLPTRELTLAEAGAAPVSTPFDQVNPEVFFTADDNDRFDPWGVPFEDGEQVVYFVTARDILGRDGEISAGLLTTVCDRMPPSVPSEIRVLNDFDDDTNTPFLEVSWRPNPPSRPGEAPTARYFVYRWETPDQMYANQVNPAFNLLTPDGIPHDPAAERMTFADLGPGAPAYPADAARTFWYSVRAEDAASCGGNLSGNGGPAWGVIREWEGPPAPSGSVFTLCESFEIQYLSAQAGNHPRVDDVLLRVIIFAPPRSTWGEARVRLEGFSGEPEIVYPLGRRGRASEGDFYYFERVIPEALLVRAVSVDARVGNDSGTVSEWVSSPDAFLLQFSADQHLETFAFDAKAGHSLAYVPLDSARNCVRHHARGLDPETEPDGRDIACVRGTLDLTTRTREFKIYRRLGLNGPLVLVDQGLQDFDEAPVADWEDCTVPAMSGAELCYYGQVYDEHGNASPLVRLGCLFSIHAALPTPMVARPRALEGGQPTARPVSLKWFCPPPGVARFEVWLRPVSGRPPAVVSEHLSPNLAEPDATLGGALGEEDRYSVYQTPPLVSGFGNAPVFEVQLQVVEGVEYQVWVRAVGAGGFGERVSGEFGNLRTFIWQPVATDPDPDGVPWPARPLPSNVEVGGVFPSIEARLLQIGENAWGVGVRVGEYSMEDPTNQQGIPYVVNAQSFNFLMPPQEPPLRHFYPSRSVAPVGPMHGERTALPFVLYRYQMPTARIPYPSFEVVQCSPRIDKFSHVVESGWPSGAIDVPVSLDPWFRAQSDDPANPLTNPTIGLYLLDLQPVSLGAAYRYLLVRFLPGGEIDDVFVLPTFTVSLP